MGEAPWKGHTADVEFMERTMLEGWRETQHGWGSACEVEGQRRGDEGKGIGNIAIHHNI